MTDKESSESRRKLLKSIAAGSGAIVAGKSLPENWIRPVVDSVMLPAHAQVSPAPTTTAQPSVCSVNIIYLITGSCIRGGYGYSISTYPEDTPVVPWFGANLSGSVTFSHTFSFMLAPGQYKVSAGAGAGILSFVGPGCNGTGQTSLSCCNGSPIPLGQNWTINDENPYGDGGADVLLTINADGTCDTQILDEH